MSCDNSSEAIVNDQNTEVKNVIKSDYADIMVKVDDVVYHLDRLQLALKSDYFEKVFIEDFYEKKCDLIELPLMDSDTFSAIVDVIYGAELKSVIKVDNYISLLMAMDYLQMKIDLKLYGSYIESGLGKEIFKLYDLTSKNRNFKALLPSVLNYLSKNLTDVQHHEEVRFLPLDHFIKIIITDRNCSPDVDMIRKLSQMCVDWILQDLENRLPHAVKLVNAARYRFHFPHLVHDETFSTFTAKLNNISEEMKKEALLRWFKNILIYRGQICPVAQEFTIDETEDIPESLDDKNERSKLFRFLENADFYDTVIKVEEKTYKLHRFKLKSASGYFADIFSTAKAKEHTDEGAPERRNKDEYFLIDGVDQTTFDMIIKYIYFEEMELTIDIVFHVFRAAVVLKVGHLLEKCKSWMETNVENFDLANLVEITKFISGNTGFENLYRFFLYKRILVEWSEIDDVSVFCSISIDTLEDMLVSPMQHFTHKWYSPTTSYFCFVEQDKLLDICSRWIIHDVQNRYHLIPRIVLAINCSLMVDSYDFKVETTADLNNCSLQFVRDKLWEVLCSTSLVPSDTLSNSSTKREFKEEPIFISHEDRNTIHILNADLDPIASLYFSRCLKDFLFSFIMSATAINDNLFILCSTSNFLHCFQVYDISSKNFMSLNCIPQVKDMVYKWGRRHTLLNCCNEVYCCFDKGYVLKYLMHLNRWTIVSKSKPDVGDEKIFFASDGKALYRMYKQPKIKKSHSSTSSYIAEVYNFELNAWISFTQTRLKTESYDDMINLTIINGDDLAAFCKSGIYSFDRRRSQWCRPISVPDVFSIHAYTSLSAITQCENGILHMCNNKLYQLSSSDAYYPSWELKKELPSESELFISDRDGGSFIAIHRTSVRPQ